jgi:diacylglycerol kinase family enzyme
MPYGCAVAASDSQARRAAVVYNPLKVDLARLKRSVRAAETEAGWAEAVWFETTKEDAGEGATRSALELGVQVVLAAGGDGTVRAVAQGLRGTGTPIALLPLGTGNLLARNLGLTLTNLSESVRNAFDGRDRRIDLGIARIVREDGHDEEHAFLVVAGLGLDAKMIAMTNSTLKKAVGWLAYVDASMRALPSVKPVKLRYALDGEAEKQLTVHTIMVGNCGSLPGGILLMPDAKPDDGILDVAALRPRGAFGWLKVWRKVAWENGVLRKSAIGRRIINLRKDVKDVSYFTCSALSLTVETPQEFQLDGDQFGTVTAVRVRVDPGALTVKMPA